jgi:hypothetical protein
LAWKARLFHHTLPSNFTCPPAFLYTRSFSISILLLLMTHTLNRMPNSFAATEANGDSLADDPVILAWQRLALAKKNDADKNALIEVCRHVWIVC